MLLVLWEREQFVRRRIRGLLPQRAALVTRKEEVQLTDSSVTARVGIGDNGADGFQLGVALVVSVPGVEREHG
ncbi:hypothetical protein [Saccharopolyspora sp. CA-218241]|uniref:hypothetical protein n=1 Tax=Saccharopolyspora sp. CA-218241 TaxID=3240027 RepID=UPI003D96777E